MRPADSCPPELKFRLHTERPGTLPLWRRNVRRRAGMSAVAQECLASPPEYPLWHRTVARGAGTFGVASSV